jgi:hypothetical protein
MSYQQVFAFLGIITALYWGYDCWLWWRSNR